MPLQVRCPHCARTCIVSDEYLGVPVLCGGCQRSFSVRSPLADRPGPGALSVPTPAAPAPPPRLEVVALTSTGRIRKKNEDHVAVHHVSWSEGERLRDAALIVIADGLGGHEAGEVASAMVVRAACAALMPLLAADLTGGTAPTSAALADAIDAMLGDVNRAIHQRARNERRPRGMGATAAVVVIRDGLAVMGHVGDTRVYHVAGGRLTQVTRDQTVAARMVELGRLSPREALTHPSRNDVFQAVGHHPDLKPARYEVRLEAGDWLIASSDGLHAHLEVPALQEQVAAPTPTASDLASRLVTAANTAGGSDNCTVAVVRCY